MDLSWLGIELNSEFWLALGQIIWINVLLSGDNAIVIALACRGLPANKRFLGIVLGALAAIVLRIIFTVFVQKLLELPYLKVIGGLLLLWVAYKLITQEDANEDGVAASESLWGAVRTIAIADVVMSLDNVLAIAAAAKGNYPLIILGLVISIPMIIGGATILTKILHRFPILVWAGAALLGWIAGDLIGSDPVAIPYLEMIVKQLGLPASLDLKFPFWLPHVGDTKVLSGATYDLGMQVAGAALVVLLGLMFRKKSAKSAENAQ